VVRKMAIRYSSLLFTSSLCTRTPGVCLGRRMMSSSSSVFANLEESEDRKLQKALVQEFGIDYERHLVRFSRFLKNPNSHEKPNSEYLNLVKTEKPKEEYSGYEELVNDFSQRVMKPDLGRGWECMDFKGSVEDFLFIIRSFRTIEGQIGLFKEENLIDRLKKGTRWLTSSDDLRHWSYFSYYQTKIPMKPNFEVGEALRANVLDSLTKFGLSENDAVVRAEIAGKVYMDSDLIRRLFIVDWKNKAIHCQLSVFDLDENVVDALDMTPDKLFYPSAFVSLSPAERAAAEVAVRHRFSPTGTDYIRFMNSLPYVPIARRCCFRLGHSTPLTSEWLTAFKSVLWPETIVEDTADEAENNAPVVPNLNIT